MELMCLLAVFLSCAELAFGQRAQDKPKILTSDDEIVDGDSMTITCLVPINYSGGTCRLYRERSDVPFRQMIAGGYVCAFHLTSSELLGSRLVGSVVRFKCDYALQQYTSAFSDGAVVIVWGSRPSPSLSVSRQVVSSTGRVEVTCTPPPTESSSHCDFYRGEYRIKSAPCSYNISGRELVIWLKPTAFRPVNFTCRYKTSQYVRSEASGHRMMFVVDAAEASSSMVCRASLEHGGGERVFEGGEGRTVTVCSSCTYLSPDNTCVAVSDQTSPGGSGDRRKFSSDS